MKNWFNSDEKVLHIVLAYAQGACKTLAESEAVTNEEKKWLRTVGTYIEKFHHSVLERFGVPYARTLKNTLNLNELRIQSKFNTKKDNIVSEASIEDLQERLNELCMLNCLGCDKKDWKDCGVYGMAVACHLEGYSDSGCPYCLAGNEIEEVW